MENRVLEKFRRGEKSLGTFTHLLSETAVEALAYTGLDYVIIDLEHSPIVPDAAAGLIAAADGAGLCPFVRVDAIERSPVLKMLDAGAMGLIVPQVESAEQVKRLVEYAKFAPLGNRGFCPTRDGGWGLAEHANKGMESYMRHCNENTLLIPQCETAACLENIEEIAAIEGVDGIFIGPFDLSISMGIPGKFDAPEFKAALERIRTACKSAGKLCIIFTGSAEAAKGYFESGYNNVAVSLDVSVLTEGYRGIVSAAKG